MQFEESHRKLRRRSSSPFDDYAHHHERGYHDFQGFPKREPHWVETEFRSSQLQYSCEVDLPYMDSAEPNLDPEIEETNDSDSKDTRLNPADYVVRIIYEYESRDRISNANSFICPKTRSTSDVSSPVRSYRLVLRYARHFLQSYPLRVVYVRFLFLSSPVYDRQTLNRVNCHWPMGRTDNNTSLRSHCLLSKYVCKPFVSTY